LPAGAVLAALLAGCGGDSASSGALTVDWTIPIGCSATQVVRIEAQAIPVTAVEGASFDSTSVSCSGGETLSFALLPAGRYDVLVEGFTSDGVATFEGRLNGVRVRGGEESQAGEVVLEQKRSGIDVNWVFENGMLCTANNVASIQLGLFDEQSVQLYAEELSVPFPCDPGATLIPSERIVGEPPLIPYTPKGILLTELIPRRSHFVHTVALTAEGEAVMKAEAEVRTEIGEVEEAILVLVPCWHESAQNVSCDSN
jgi:hypothetical protein